MRKVFWAVLLIAIVSFTIWSKDPLNDVVNFIIGGIIPKTNVSIGFWGTIAIATGVLYAVRRAIKNTRLQMLENTAKQIKAEELSSDFESKSAIEFDHSKRSVIAAPATNSTVF